MQDKGETHIRGNMSQVQQGDKKAVSVALARLGSVLYKKGTSSH